MREGYIYDITPFTSHSFPNDKRAIENLKKKVPSPTYKKAGHSLFMTPKSFMKHGPNLFSPIRAQGGFFHVACLSLSKKIK